MKQKFDLRARTTKAETSFRFGVLANSLFLEAWQHETIRLLLEEGHRLEIVIIKKESHERPSFISRIQNYPYNRLLFRLWNRFIFKPSSKKTKDITELLSGAKLMECSPMAKGYASEFPDEMIQILGNENLDFILRFGFNILIRFHFDNNYRNVIALQCRNKFIMHPLISNNKVWLQRHYFLQIDLIYRPDFIEFFQVVRDTCF